MLNELRIQNFAIIEQLDLKFGPGLLIFTGETGAGKSIIMDAVEMLLGGRADSTVIRAEAEQARVEGTFRLTGAERAAAHEILKREELFDDPNYVTLSREVRREGRNIARVNGRTVNLALLRELGEVLVDIHGQSEHLSLLKVPAHLGLLDRYADVGALLAAYREIYQQLLSIRRELNELRQAQHDAEQRTEMLTFQAEEIDFTLNTLRASLSSRLMEERLQGGLREAAEIQASLLPDGAPSFPPWTIRR